ncbi:signal peptide peptidase-like 2B [Homarus americanus]|uniref:signal peptide peptidase-like 2B n=1 Tax=Homarus americanus TaxID=6706 RepID=UPI001C45443A|nr:signal peptide peptidase-like 2B [Homarus americanus]
MAERVTLILIFTGIVTQCAAEGKSATPICGILNSRPDTTSDYSEKYCILFYKAIHRLAVDEDSAQYFPVSDALEWDVCNETESPPATLDIENRYIFVSSDNNCSHLERASRVQSLGGAGTLIVREKLQAPRQNDTNYNFTLAFVQNSSYTKIMDAGDNVTVGLYSPEDSVMPVSLLIIWIMAVFSIAVGAFWSGKVRHKLYLSEQFGQEVEVNEEASHPVFILLWCLCMMLLSLYFLYDYLVYVIIGMFCIASGVAVFCCLQPIISLIPCGSCSTPYFNIYIVRGTMEVRNIFLLIFSLGLPVVWAVMRKEPWAWILQDILGIAFSINMLRMIRLPSLKICTILLCGLVIYDIFFVFITPFITSDGQSIMVEVAKGGASKEQLPMVLKVPNLAYLEISTICQLTDNFNLLGFGDILIPGLLVSFVHSFDLRVGTPCRLYYLVNLIGYGTGLVVTFIALWLLNEAQPALLYLVPFTLLPTYIVAAIRGEVVAMWHGDSNKFESEREDDVESADDDVPNGTAPVNT